MALFQSGNPTLSQKIFSKSASDVSGEVMTVRGTMNKFGFMLFMVIGGAAYTWRLLAQGAPDTMQTFMMIGLFGGLVCALAIIFKPVWAPFLAPAYGLLEGFFLGGISAVMNQAFAEKYPGLVMQSVGLTFGVAIAMFLLYNFKVIKATEKLRSVIISATMGIAIFYLISMVLRMFGVNMPFMYDSSALGIGISLFVIAIAALNLILDFDMIERGAEQGAPKYMEWYGAFGLLITLVWLYLEILKLMSRFAGRK